MALIFSLKKYKDRANIGGYLSYNDGELSKCIFYSAKDNPKVIGTITFDSSYSVQKAITDLTERDFTSIEKDLYSIRKIALDIVNSGDTLFKFYDNTNLNLIPIIFNGEKKVYIVTGPKKTGVVIFGNDYLFTFDNKNKLIEKKRLHMSLIAIEYGRESKDGEEVLGSAHTHLPITGNLMTPTDICTLLLYARFAKWKQHMVISEKYMNIWNCESNRLVVLPREAWEKIYKDDEPKTGN